MAVPRVYVAGVRADGPGYPNAEWTLDALRGYSVAEIVDLGERMPGQMHLWRLRGESVVRQALTLGWLLFANARSLVRVFCKWRDRACLVYVPYPAIPFLCLARLVPRGLRPKCVADAYISLWDAQFNDRSRAGKGWLSDIVKAVEGWALRGATHVLVDTVSNRRHLIEQFKLAPERVHAVPLAIDARPFKAVREAPRSGAEVRVLFVGTFIPLHGVEVVVEAARHLRARSDISITLVGDGQLGSQVDALLRAEALPALHWERRWVSLARLADHMGKADICLGVFGGPGKAERVLPFKVYYALAAGKAVISQGNLSLPEGLPNPPFVAVEGATIQERASSLAGAITMLVDDAPRRDELQQMAAAYYDIHLSSRAVACRWSRLLDSHFSSSIPA